MTQAPNPFDTIAEQQLTAAAKARHRAAKKRLAKLVVTSERDAPMVAKPADKAMYAATAQFKEYRRWLKQRKETLLSGPYSAQLAELMAMLRAISPDTAPALVDFIEHADWLQQADESTRYNTLSIVAEEISRWRVREGLAPFDDSLPDEPPTAFEQIRFMLTGIGVWQA